MCPTWARFDSVRTIRRIRFAVNLLVEIELLAVVLKRLQYFGIFT
jgi:hypothetical protein